MPSNKRFRIGNTTLNLGKINDTLQRRTDLFTITGAGCGCGINYSTLPPTNICCNRFTPNPTVTGCGCGINFSTLPNTTLVLDSVNHPIDVKDLKESLINQLKEVEAYELEVKAQETPQTLEEMNELENELQNSLKELQEMKKKFKG